MYVLLLLGLINLNVVVLTDNITARFVKLEAEINSLKVKNTQMRNEIINLQGKSIQSCQLQQPGICGQCNCFDDFDLREKYYCDCKKLTPKQDCLAFYREGFKLSGIYTVTMNNMKTMPVYCDQVTDGGGWTVIQRRIGSDKYYFQRNWNDYKKGFGYLQHEFYMGNENLHILTLQAMFPRGSQLRIDLTNWSESETAYAKYTSFQIGNEMTKFQIHAFGYSGNAGNDSLISRNGARFSTNDQNNQLEGTSRGWECSGGWWYYDTCAVSNLNSRYFMLGSNFWKGYPHRLHSIEMKVKRNI